MKQIIVNSTDQEKRVALLEAGKLIELWIERPGNERLEGNIYKGKVVNILPGMQAAFVDIGLEKNAYLYIDDCLSSLQKEEKPNIREILTEGQELVVQLTKEPVGTKGARVTTQLSFPGRFIVYMPDDPYIGISRKIEGLQERKRLQEICEKLRENQEGIIVRTMGEGATSEELTNDFFFLRAMWKKVLTTARASKPQRLIHKDFDLVIRIVRDVFSPDIDELLIDHVEDYTKLMEQLGDVIPDFKKKIKLYTERTGIFDTYHIESELEKTLKRKVWLKNGGYLIIDRTEALTSIDVNTGKFTGSRELAETVFKTNLEATKEIARQLRLRDLGGIIIIDFIDMFHQQHRNTVLDSLKEELKKDRTKTHILGFTQLGLLEMTRKKARQTLEDYLTKPCPYCEGTGKISSEETVCAKIEREIREYAKNPDIEAVLLEIHPQLEKHLNSEKTKRWGVHVYLRTNENLHQTKYTLPFVGTVKEVKERALQSPI
ncbi:Rne/Rng family ribonuclease [Ammoniphilus resinae]|uniref:Ribonuclease G n=1 Tax=Ammoniphilus resinae TaxID=861532 RepID=A0ABS4GKH9_9BACL|nr:Rne/Rng family ribonuclease [Ammoniphilus resinae]MBP1930415.1 ribonuclease G [Ammoniphilus resinae]